ncbi:unnamed protein product [Lactuca saligna]|uniref:Uncharacterized protein n=1 Tax=Lactuca saligna TaxID=75948 RepID=A0AA35Z9D0_LACSI|nr:unnamed protein product [Lactuca saligna]
MEQFEQPSNFQIKRPWEEKEETTLVGAWILVSDDPKFIGILGSCNLHVGRKFLLFPFQKGVDLMESTYNENIKSLKNMKTVIENITEDCEKFLQDYFRFDSFVIRLN